MKRSLIMYRVLLALSVSYNFLWYAASDAILEIDCVGHSAAVHADADASEQHNDWVRAAYLYGYLLDYHPRAIRGCLSSDDIQRKRWLLPAGALVWKWQFSKAQSKSDAIRELDDKYYLERYNEATGHIGLPRGAGIDKGPGTTHQRELKSVSKAR